MCGIVGVVGAVGEPEREQVAMRMNECQTHRGPDHAAIFSSGSSTIGYTRLAIQKPTPAGHQPAWSRDRRYCLVFNGEVYNWKELIRTHHLKGDGSDAMVIADLWERLGEGALALLRGMFAIAVLDTMTGSVTLARDPFGIKPLFIWSDGKECRFASEVVALRGSIADVWIDRDALATFLRLGAMMADQAPYEGMSAIPPGHSVVVHPTSAGVSITTARPFVTDAVEAPSDDGAGVAAAFQDSVRAHLVSDVPIALLLSAGFDSTAIALACAREGRPLHCLTVSDPDMVDEATLASATARRFGHTHAVVPSELDSTGVDRFFRHMQRPTVDGLNTHLVCAAVQDAGYRVALSGLGGDEALGGYRHARMLPLLRPLRVLDRVPDAPKRLLLNAAGRVGLRDPANPKVRRLVMRGGPRDARGLTVLQREVFNPREIAGLVGSDQVCDRVPAGAGDQAATSIQAWSRAERELYMESMLLPDVDAFSMAHSVELRVPFVDTHFFAAADKLKQRLDRRSSKLRLAAALADPWLESIARRRKATFSLPIKTYMTSGALRPSVDAMLDPAAPVWQVLDPTARRRFSPPSDDGPHLQTWAIVVLNEWLRRMQS